MTKSSNTEGVAHNIWNFFASVKLSVVILLSLAATSVIGTVVPQNGNTEAYIERYGETLFKLFSTLDFFDMYHSWWYRALLCLLTINITVCSIHRLSSTWKIIFPKHPSFDANRFQKVKTGRNGLPGVLRRRCTKFMMPTSPDGFQFPGQKKQKTGISYSGKKAGGPVWVSMRCISVLY